MNSRDLEKIFSFLETIYKGNWVYRWGDVPFMDYKEANTVGESILAHQYACIALWSLLRKHMPETNTKVDTPKIVDLLLYHDIGEIGRGDTPLVRQLHQGSEDKNTLEKEQINEYAHLLPEHMREWMVGNFTTFTHDQDDAEALIARYLNALQGNHFALVYGVDLPKHKQVIEKIVTRFFTPISDALITKMSSIDQIASKEWQALTDYHLAVIHQKVGI